METSFAWLEIFLNASFWVASVRIATPLIFGTLGEVICERAGVLNLGIEGIMTLGAMAGWISVAGLSFITALSRTRSTVSSPTTIIRACDSGPEMPAVTGIWHCRDIAGGGTCTLAG